MNVYEVNCKLKRIMFVFNMKEIMLPCEDKGLCMALALAEI